MDSSTVEIFNSLPRSRMVPSGAVENNWHISIKHVPLHPPGDLVFLINPPSRYIHTEGPAQVLQLDSVDKQAEKIVPMILSGFNKGMGMPSDARRAPWSFSTTSQELAEAIGRQLKEVGVSCEELCDVKWGREEEDRIAAEEWPRFVGMLMGSMGMGRNQRR